MVEPTPITDAGLEAFERDIRQSAAIGYDRSPVNIEIALRVVHRLRTAEAGVARLTDVARHVVSAAPGSLGQAYAIDKLRALIAKAPAP